MLRSSRLEDHMKTIGIDQSLCTRSSFEHKFMNNIKKIYQHAGKCDNQQNLKDNLYYDMVLTPELVTYNSPNVHMISTSVKKPSARKSLCLFTNILDVKQKTEKHRFVAIKSKRRAMKVSNILWTKKTRRKGHSKINEQIKCNLYVWITRHPQVVQSPISNHCLKVMLDVQTEPQLVPKLLLQVSVRELHKSLVSDTHYGGLKDARDEDDNIIIRYFTLCSLLPPQLKQMYACYKVMCGCECCISTKSIHSSLLPWHDRYLKNSKTRFKMLKTEGLVKNHITYMKHIKIL